MKTFYLSLLFFVGICLGYLAPSVSIASQVPLYDYLKNLSSIAFAILGAWIALLIPSTVEKVENREKTVETISTIISDLRPLTLPMNVSVVVLIVGLISVFCSTVLSKQEYLYRYAPIGRIISLEVLFVLSVAQIWAIIYAVFPVNKFMNFAKQIKARRERIKAEKKR